MLKTDQYYDLDQDIIDQVENRIKEFAFAMDLKFIYQTNNKLKQLIQVKKLPDNYAVLLSAEIMIVVNDDYFDKVDEDIQTILIDQELDKIEMNFQKETFKITQPGLKTSFGIVEKFSYERVERAIEAVRLLNENKADKDGEQSGMMI